MANSTWRELCKKITDEKDPHRLIMLVEALNKELERCEQESRLGRQHPLRNREPDLQRLDTAGDMIGDIAGQVR